MMLTFVITTLIIQTIVIKTNITPYPANQTSNKDMILSLCIVSKKSFDFEIYEYLGFTECYTSDTYLPLLEQSDSFAKTNQTSDDCHNDY